MNRLTLALAIALPVLSSCAHPYRPQEAAGATELGAPRPTRAAATFASGAPPPLATPVRWPDRLSLPGAYRLVLLDGHLTLVRETDAQTLSDETGSLRIVVGNASQGELAFQPAPLPQELAAELAANRESTARMDKALTVVMERSRELSKQALEIESQSARIAELLKRQGQVGGPPSPSGAAAADPMSAADPPK